MTSTNDNRTRTMKAWVYERYGSPDVLELRDIDVPTPKDDQVLVRVRVAGINAADWRLLRANPPLVRLMLGLRRPRKPAIPGSDAAGVVEAMGKDVTRFRPGDEVYGEVRLGGFAEYVAVPQNRLARKPGKLTFEQAAAVPMAALTALTAVRSVGRVEAGQTVLVNGAGGGVGHFAVQLAKAFGAEVTGVCSTGKLELVRSLGADHAIDYTQEDFTKSGRRYDLVVDTVGNHTLEAFRRALASRGTFAIVGGGSSDRLLGPMDLIIKGSLLSPFARGQRLKPVTAEVSSEHLESLGELIENGKVRPAIDRVVPFAEAPDAIRYLEQGHASGKVVVSVWDGTAGEDLRAQGTA
jgi:NADPH:quinone reductase-like Zn-dependent oxidoreductase